MGRVVKWVVYCRGLFAEMELVREFVTDTFFKPFSVANERCCERL